MPTLIEDILSRLEPVHCQIILDNEELYLIPFSDYIYLNGIGVNTANSQHQITERGIVLDVEDSISVGIEIYWQQWATSLGLACKECRYAKLRLLNDEWCAFCEKQHYNPAPYIHGYSREFRIEDVHIRNVGYFNYANCETCGLKVHDWCVECTFHYEPEFKNKSAKAHINMYEASIRGCQFQRVSPQWVDSLKDDEIFVFGSNLAGIHGGGAAAIAHKKFGAVWGKGVGLHGQTYAIPIMQGGVETIKPYVDEFLEFTRVHPKLKFFVTEIGCGIAGFTPLQIAPLFRVAVKRDLENVFLPESFYQHI